jgi:hypothetical protein
MIIRHVTSACLLILTVALLAGCNESDLTGPPVDTSVIMPLKVGNMWIDRMSEYDPTGALTSTSFDTVTIISDDVIGNEHWFRNNQSVWRTNRSDGSWVRIDGIDIWLAMKYPAAVLDTFHTDYWQETLENGEAGPQYITYLLVTSIDTAITVPAGTFHCYSYKAMGAYLDGSPLPDSMGATGQYFCSPGRGLVKSESPSSWNFGAGLRGKWIRELVEARLK